MKLAHLALKIFKERHYVQLTRTWEFSYVMESKELVLWEKHSSSCNEWVIEYHLMRSFTSSCLKGVAVKVPRCSLAVTLLWYAGICFKETDNEIMTIVRRILHNFNYKTFQEMLRIYKKKCELTAGLFYTRRSASISQPVNFFLMYAL